MPATGSAGAEGWSGKRPRVILVGGAILVVVIVAVLIWVAMNRDRDPRE